MIMENQEKKSYLLPIVMMFALFFMISFVTGLQNPLGKIVKSQFDTSVLLSQLGNFANFIAYAFMGIPAGKMLQNIGYKKTALTAIVVGFAGVCITYFSGVLDSFGVYLAGAFVAGFSMCMLNVVVNPMLNTLGGGGKKGNQLLQFGGALNSIGATIAPVLGGYLIGNLATAKIANANPVLFLAMGIFALTFIVLTMVQIPEPQAESSRVEADSKISPLSFRHFVLGAVAIFLYVGIEVGIANISNVYMQNLGIAEVVAGSVVGTYWFLMFIGRFIGGGLGNVISSKAMLSFVSALGLILVTVAIFMPESVTVTVPALQENLSFAMAEVPISILFFVLCGLCTSVMWGGIFNLATNGLGKYTAAASGIFMVMVCGGGILPALQGWVADVVGYIQSYWVIVLALAYLLFYALAGSKNVNTDIKVD
ncbi:MFS transporter [Capnocytophaga sp. Marseille-Q4570]|uniref:MFS transporter n=2 Tax=Capnocytophaga bilenii TaxID=2819369 RepID=A0ABS3PVU1_9FLAO|nr:MFS transporter [Capnocytophaga bilenii]MBO1883453.1 MFS transporter [Capnocytophaga bilenii]